ncbi:YdcF family protein [Fimbriimonas ginsengisoli]|uniref:DUF218 domain-containing protein n=1 Tax=Fimbriimonas ginsengisoli Gsoil 348 TaxID=661478 RepID=A0A068NQX1_FIMGI|nr:YdcF family protein [Fimbriimonas ginsengisoli]AIE85943.1 hypothetical protein OP10G_2575 [Fimbriimonas ginsengisoli Gsoil 348]
MAFSSFEAYEASLSIPREGEVPELSPHEIEQITRLVFIGSDPRPSEVLFVFGTVQGDWETMARMLRDGDCERAILTGYIGPSVYDRGLPIADEMREKLLAHGAPEDRIAVMNRSNNTLEDVEMSLPLLQGVSNILLAAKAHHSGRCLLTLRRFFPEIPIHCLTVDAYYGDILVTRNNWTTTPLGRARVWGEYQRILAYSAKGDIASP